MSANKQLDLPDLLSQLGEFGPYQLKQHCLHNLAWLLSAVHTMSFVFVFPVVEHRCFVKEVDEFHYENIDISNEIQMYIPRNKGKFESCVAYDNFNGTIHPCENGYVYNYTVFPSSRVADWDMVCDRNWMRALLQSIFLLGVVVGAVTSGNLADKYGRKSIFCISGVLQLIFGVVGPFLDNYYMFAFSLFWYGLFGAAGAVVPSVALTMELVGPSQRSICGTMFTVSFGLGCIIVAAWAYFLVVPAKVLQLIYAGHSVLLLGHYWLMDESICWLWSNGNKQRAIEIAKKAIKSNGKEFVNNPTLAIQKGEVEDCERGKSDTQPKVEVKKVGTWDLFRYPKLRGRMLVMMICWFASCLAYFGLSFNSVNLLGNPYLMFVVTILVEIPGHIISLFFTSKTGNKLMFFVTLIFTGASCVAVPLLPKGIVTICITMIAKVTATVTFNVINGYTAELFPTCLRNTAIGICIMMARLGAAIIPQINLLGNMAEEIPIITFGVMCIIAGLLSFSVLPETMNIPQTIDDIETPVKR